MYNRLSYRKTYSFLFSKYFGIHFTYQSRWSQDFSSYVNTTSNVSIVIQIPVSTFLQAGYIGLQPLPLAQRNLSMCLVLKNPTKWNFNNWDWERNLKFDTKNFSFAEDVKKFFFLIIVTIKVRMKVYNVNGRNYFAQNLQPHLKWNRLLHALWRLQQKEQC